MKTIKPAIDDRDRTSLELLYSISRQLGSQLDLRALLSRMLELTIENVGAFSGSILVLDEQGRVVEGSLAYGGEVINGTAKQLADTYENGLAGWVFRHREAVLLLNTHEDPRWLRRIDNYIDDAPRSAVSVPLIAGERVAGVLTLAHPQEGYFNQSHLSLLRAIADQAGMAVANAQLFADSQRQTHAMEALANAARVVTASLDLDEVLQRIIEQTMRSLDVAAASLALLDGQSDELVFRASSGEGSENLVGIRIALGTGIAGWVTKKGKAALIPDVKADSRFYNEIDKQTGFETKTVACAPILVHGKAIGALEAINPKRGRFIPGELDLIQGIAGLAGTAIAHAQLFASTQAAQRRYAGLFEGNIDPILITDLSGIITDANQPALDFIDSSLEDLLGKSIPSLQVYVPEAPKKDLSELEAGQTFSYNCRIIRSDRSEAPVGTYIKRIDIGPEPVLQWILRDISERIELDQMRSDLTSMIFHDLRSPLGNIISSIEVLQSALPEMNEDVKTVISVAERSSRRLSRLVDSFLDLNQLESGKAVLNKTRGALDQIIREAVEEMRPLTDAKKHSLIIKKPKKPLPLVEMDVDMIRRVVINLLDNAIKYTPSGGRIVLVARCEKDSVLVSVKDNGPGIAKRNQTVIFEKFSRLRRRPGKPKGLGLGLAFCRLVVETHGGKIKIKSEPGKGSTFSFTLPV